MDWPKVALVLYPALNTILYASLLPLWEGFDEPFHYGYVQQLSRGLGLPELGKTTLPGEISASIEIAPAS